MQILATEGLARVPQVGFSATPREMAHQNSIARGPELLGREC